MIGDSKIIKNGRDVGGQFSGNYFLSELGSSKEEGMFLRSSRCGHLICGEQAAAKVTH